MPHVCALAAGSRTPWIRLVIAAVACVSVGSVVACSSDGGASDDGAGSDTDDGTTGDPIEFTCAPERAAPYPSPMSYVGVHAGPANDDLVACDLGASWEQSWHVLQGRGIAQPNTFSPDGRTTYVTTSEPVAGDCSLWAIDTVTGETRWCLSVPGVLFSTVEVDEDGNLYATANSSVTSWTPEGDERWSVEIPGKDPERNATGLHFTPAGGHVVTVTDDGVVLVLARTDGAILAELDLQAEFGFVPLMSLGLDLMLEPLLPQPVRDDFAELFGPGGVGGALGKFVGGSGNFSDNTVGIAPDGTLYVVGGGPDETHGALMQIRVTGSAEAPSLEPGWAVVLESGSASSPAVSPDGRWVKVSDGNSLSGFLDPAMATATMHVVDIDACDANEDADAAADRCVAAHEVPLLTGPALGASPVYEDGDSWRWEVQFGALFETGAPDLVRTIGDTTELEVDLPEDRVWSSVLTLTNDYVIGTMTALTPSDETLLSITLPATATTDVVVVSRSTGEVVFRAPVTDDSTSTVTVGPDGALYVTQLALLHSLSVETGVVGGFIRFAPTDAR